jgi:carbon monoxide dehydrogenase subunit G
MSDVNMTFKHHRTQEEARARLADAVGELQSRFGTMVRQVDWSGDGNEVHISGSGFTMDATVGAEEVHVVGDIPLLGRLFGGSLAAGVKQILDRTFQKKLT